jgi:hypothetical protein
MLTFKKALLASIVCLLVFSQITFAYSDEIALEKSYTEKAQNALDSIYGEDVFFVVVDVSLTAPKYKVKYTEESNAKTRKKKKKNTKMQVMPGYPVIRNLAPSDMKTLPFDSITSYIPPKITKVVVNLYVNKAYSKSRARKAIKLVNKLLNLNPKRDKVNLKQEKFYKKPVPRQTIEITNSEPQLLTYQNLYYLITLVFFLIFFIVYTILQLKGIKAKSKAGAGGSKGGGQTNVNVNPNLELKGGGGGGGPSGDLKLSSAPPIKQYFDFIHEGNIHKVLYVVKKEKLPIDKISILVAFLNPKPASMLIAELDSKTQAAIAVSMLQQKMNDKQTAEKFEAHMQNSLECLSGGPESFKDTFDYVSSESKKNILKILRGTNPQGYQRVRNNVLIFDDLRNLEDEELKILISETSVEVLACALASVDQETYRKIDQNLMKSAKDMIEQFLDLKGKSLTKKDIEQSQTTVLNIASRLEAEGKIVLRSKINS